MTTETPSTTATSDPLERPVGRLVPQHDWRDAGLDTHNGEYWYKCAMCGASDWIASYGKKDQLMPRECKPPNVELVTPVAWRAVGGTIWGHKGSDDDTPLYDQAALEAAVAAERERWQAEPGRHTKDL